MLLIMTSSKGVINRILLSREVHLAKFNHNSAAPMCY